MENPDSSISTRIDASSPCKNSSIRTFPSVSMAHFAASTASAIFSVTVTPFPAASPSLLITQGLGYPSNTLSISELSVIMTEPAVGTPSILMMLFACCFDPSSNAPSAFGPKQLIPKCLNRSANPATRGASGPIMTRSAAIRTANSHSPSMSSTATS